MDHDENETQPMENAAASSAETPTSPPESHPGQSSETPTGAGPGDSPSNLPPPPSPWFAAGGTPLPPPPGSWWTPGQVPSEEAPRGSGRKIAVLVGIVALLAGGLGAGLDAAVNSSSHAPGPSGTVATLPRSDSGIVPSSTRVSDVASAVDPAVVDIDTRVASAVGNATEAAAGTGMVISASGLVLTNNHVVESATNIKVTIQGHGGSYKAKVLGVDPTQDVALIKIENPPTHLSYVSTGNSGKVSVGTPVVAIGNALGLGGKPSVSSGTITSTNRTITAGDELTPSTPETLHHLFETDAPIQSGDSGGPLVTLQGQVIGMDTAAASSDSTTGSLGFAIPINEALQIAKSIEHHQSSSRITLGLTAFLGVTEQSGGSSGGVFGQPTGSTSSSGVFISDVITGSPAEAAGLQAGDSITSIDGTTTNSIQSLQSAIRSHKPGQSVTLTYKNQAGSSHTATVKLAGIPL
ncbi:MAG: trypsin-like peptidase domain-containing protein [Acidimicrobiales bacterium]